MKMKSRSRLIEQYRVYWNDFDPIGVIDLGEDDVFDDSEYNAYGLKNTHLSREK